MPPHTILLMQPGGAHTRTYVDYESPESCYKGILKIYEQHLKGLNPEAPFIAYNMLHLLEFLDEIRDIGCLIYQKAAKGYVPYNKHWVKENMFLYLRDVALNVESNDGN